MIERDLVERKLICSCQGARESVLIKEFTHCGGNGLGVPPVPIPNTEVKPQHVDGTWLVTARESRSLPHSHSRLAYAGRAFWRLKSTPPA